MINEDLCDGDTGIEKLYQVVALTIL